MNVNQWKEIVNNNKAVKEKAKEVEVNELEENKESESDIENTETETNKIDFDSPVVKEQIKEIREENKEAYSKSLEEEKPKRDNLFESTDYSTKDIVGQVSNIPVELLKDNPLNTFSRLKGEKREEMINSIRERGIDQPLIVRQKGNYYEIIAGHNRRACAVEVGFKKVPCIVKDIDDIEASVMIGTSNIQREETTDLEWGYVYRNTLELIKEQRNNQGVHREHPTKGKKTIEIVAEKYGIASATVRRKIRLTYLVIQLYNLYEKKKIKQDIAVELSYLSELLQENTAGAIDEFKIINIEIAKELREFYKENPKINIDDVYDIFKKHIEKQSVKEEEKTEKVKKYKVADEYFPDDIKSIKDRETYLKDILGSYHNN